MDPDCDSMVSHQMWGMSWDRRTANEKMAQRLITQARDDLTPLGFPALGSRAGESYVHALDMLLPEAGAIYVVDRGYVDFARLYVLHRSMLIASIRRRRIARPASFATRPSPWTGELLRRIRSGKTLVFITNNFSLPAATICALYKSRWQVASSDQAVLRHVGERGEDADLDCRLGLRPRRHRQEAPRPGRLALLCPYIKHLRETKTDATLRK